MTLIGFESLAAYEEYRKKLVADPEAKENVEFAKRSGCILIEDRSLLLSWAAAKSRGRRSGVRGRKGQARKNFGGARIIWGVKMSKEYMKKKILIFLAVVLAIGTPLAPQANAIDLSISVGDRPYYHGGGYWHEGYYWVWVPGHYSHSRGGWVPGHYIPPRRLSCGICPQAFPLSPRLGRARLALILGRNSGQERFLPRDSSGTGHGRLFRE